MTRWPWSQPYLPLWLDHGLRARGDHFFILCVRQLQHKDCVTCPVQSDVWIESSSNPSKRRVAIRCNFAYRVPVGGDEIEIDLLPETRSPIMYRHVVLWVTLSTADGQQLKETVHLRTVCQGKKVPTTRKGEKKKKKKIFKTFKIDCICIGKNKRNWRWPSI